MPTPKPFLPHGGTFKNLIVYQKAECIYDITYYFAHHFLEKGDRTIDQMVQAARSGKQNIAEGASAGNTSKETEIKLTNVAKASLQELLVDYEDYLRVRGLEQWQPDDLRLAQAKRACAAHNDSAYYRNAIPKRSAETIANIAITLIHQTDWMLNKLIQKLEIMFVKGGGMREQMTKARKEFRGY
uniref:four helix bundle suffix domain-containing protein n=1 Tax=Prevotella sp. TaxID=59823 RepID=UPI00261A3915